MNNLCCSYIYYANMTDEKLKNIDFTKIDILNAAFSVLEKNEKGFYVPTLSGEIKSGIIKIKSFILNQNAPTKLVISIGGWKADYFCPASSTAQSRKEFALACKAMIDDCGVDGIDLDWEFPGEQHEGIMACKNCKMDFIKLCIEIREQIGSSLLTCAVGSNKYKGIDAKTLNKVADYIYVMTYDMNRTCHSNLIFTKFCMSSWARCGIDKNKLLAGIPFYARHKNTAYDCKSYNELMSCVESGKASLKAGRFQDYIVMDKKRLSLDTPNSIKIKSVYVKEKGYAGMFCWEETNDRNGQLRTAMYESLNTSNTSS